MLRLSMRPYFGNNWWVDPDWRGEKLVHVVHCGEGLEPDPVVAAETNAAIDAAMGPNSTFLAVFNLFKSNDVFSAFVFCPHQGDVENLCHTEDPDNLYHRNNYVIEQWDEDSSDWVS